MSQSHAADLDELRELVDRMATCALAIGALADDVSAHERALHATWSGAASRAHGARQAVWYESAGRMHDALGALRGHVGQARANYLGAIEANLRLWEQLR